RNGGAKAVDNEGTQREPDALLELGGLGKCAKTEISRELFGSGSHALFLMGAPPFSALGSPDARRRSVGRRRSVARRIQASGAAACFGATVVVTEPPACSTAAFAAADAPDTVIVTARLISPSASSLTPSSLPCAKPAAIRIASVIGWLPSILPASIAASSEPILTGAYSLRK